MPQNTKKDHKCSHHTARRSRWHNFHFSGKLIVCSVILGFMLILIGGILMAIGMDEKEDTKTDRYEDLQKKPPMVYVGPTIMGIGGFAVVVGVLMCLIETKVCRKMNPDASPLINGEGDQTEVKSTDDSARESDPTAVPSTSRHNHHRNGGHKKSPSPRKSKSKKYHPSTHKKQMKSGAQLSPSSDENENSSKNFLMASDKFLTPPDSFADEGPGIPEQHRKKENQVTTSLMQSFTSSGKSWNTSNEFQTPSASFIDDPLSLQFMDREEEQNENHKFLSPQNSNPGVIDESPIEEPGAYSNPNKVTDSDESIPEKVKSLEVSVSLPTTEDGRQTAAQGSSGVVLSLKSSSTAEIESMEQNNNQDDLVPTLTSETIGKELLNEDTQSSAASYEENENCVKDDTHGSDEQVNTSMEENAPDNIKDESTLVHSEEHSIEISDPQTVEISVNEIVDISTEIVSIDEKLDIED